MGSQAPAGLAFGQPLPQGALIHQKLPDGSEVGQDEGRLSVMTEFVHANLPIFQHAAILDLGSNCGHFPLEYIKAGANRVTIVEGRQRFIDVFERVREAMGSKFNEIEPHCKDIREFQPIGQYQVVSCLGLIYHVNGIWPALYRIIKEVNAQVLLVESEVYPEDFQALEYGEAGDASKAIKQELVLRPSVAHVEAVLNEMGFDPYKIDLSELYSTRRGFWFCKRKGVTFPKVKGFTSLGT